MPDRPTVGELIEAIRGFIEVELLPELNEPRLRYRTLVAANALRIVERELAADSTVAAAEWMALDELLGEVAPPRPAATWPTALIERQRQLELAIRAGAFDAGPARQRLLAYLRLMVINKLRLSNPDYLARHRQRSDGGEQ